VQTVEYTFQKYVIENPSGLLSQIGAGVEGMVVWALIIFGIVMVFPPFRRFFFEMFGSKESS
jgi:hypothetical protein